MCRWRDLGGVFVGLLVGLTVGWLLWSGGASTAQSWAANLGHSDAVVVIAVETEQNLDRVRRSVSSERILVNSDTGFAVEPQRIVVTSLEFAGEILAMAGWQDRPLEIVYVRRRARTDEEEDEQASRIAALVNKPTLTRGEAYVLLNSM